MINFIKESITNALKHGKASAIEISVLEEQDTIQIMVKDNGRGCDSFIYGFGLKSMEERIEAIGGQLSVQSEPMKGFALHRGYNSKEIAEKLFLTQGTVKNYLSDLYTKIGTNDRAKAVLLLKRYLST
ncbi:hypothetical protein J7E73_18895 [Paenibacillus albidus]|uniref:helix-turn-helix transcriptional regulator n=1 Tax=Paenibacillus albidus TaxID=2041023 RepID=UPI001BE7AEAC|nr:ATP-binding protein [Paenibacillus albidus]MBT2291169.1 hypothetical protein [Paenibacillus albidus]